MIFILEGNECCFKTTVANLLSKAIEYPVIKGSSFEMAKSTNEELNNKFLEFAKMDKVIFDRFIFSNYVYATLYKDYSILTEKQREEIIKQIKNKTLVIYLYAPSEIIKKRLRKRGDEYVKEDEIDEINKLFNETMIDTIEQSHIQVFPIDTSKYSPEEIVYLILQHVTTTPLKL